MLHFNETKLDFIEVIQINTEIKTKIKYKYHFMDKENKLIFRYDNTKHYTGLENFPHHKHIESNVLPCNEPDIITILKEIKDFFNN